VDGTASGLCAVVGFGINSVELLCSVKKLNIYLVNARTDN
jgi:hypothetical protein